jgi:hypothetical protein
MLRGRWNGKSDSMAVSAALGADPESMANRRMDAVCTHARCKAGLMYRLAALEPLLLLLLLLVWLLPLLLTLVWL